MQRMQTFGYLYFHQQEMLQLEDVVVCGLCKQLVYKVWKYRNKLEQGLASHIEHALDKLCYMIVVFLVPCRMLIHQKLQQMISQFNKGLTPDKVCIRLNLCTMEEHSAMITSPPFSSDLEIILLPKTERLTILASDADYQGPLAFRTLQINSVDNLVEHMGPTADEWLDYYARYNFIANKRDCPAPGCNTRMSLVHDKGRPPDFIFVRRITKQL